MLSEGRRVLITLRDQGLGSDGVLLRLQQDLDIEAMHIGLGEERPPGPSPG